MDVEQRIESLEARLRRVEARLRLEAAEPFLGEPAPPVARQTVVVRPPSPSPSPGPGTVPASAVAPEIPPEFAAARRARLERDTLAPSVPVGTSPLAPPTPAVPAPAAPSAPRPVRPLATISPEPGLGATSRPPVSRRARPAAKTSIDYERFVGVAVLGRVGIAAVLLAAGYFGQLGWREIGPWGRVSVVYGLAAVFIAVGEALKPRVSRLYVALLWGGGAAAMYLAGVLAKLRFGLVGPTGGLAMLVAACAVGQVLASRARFQVLAITALAGAFAAPLLVGGPEDARTVLLVYLLALHGWSAFTESRFGWTGARLVGLLGAAIVGTSWLATHGRVDVSTFLHVQGYLFGVTVPEWGGALLRRDVSRPRAALFRVLTQALEVVSFGSAFLAVGGDHAVVATVLPGVALAWTTIAALVRARARAPAPMSVALARLSTLLLVPSAWAVFGHRGLSASEVATLALGTLAALSAGLLASRRWFGLGDRGPLAAAALSIAVLATIPHPDARLLLALVPAAGLVGWAREARPRVAGYAAGVVAIGVGFAAVPDVRWIAVEFGAVAAWAILALESRRLQPGDDLDLAVDVSLLGAVVVWTALALWQGPFVEVPTPFRNPGTAAALALAAALVVRAPWRGERAFPRGTAPLVGGMLVALVLLVAWRELHAALAAHASAGAQAGVETFFFVAAALLALAIGRRAGSRAFAALAVALTAAGGVRAAMSFETAGADAWWVAAELGALAAGAAAIGAVAMPGERVMRSASALLLVGTGLLFAAAPGFQAPSGASLVANPGFVAGVFVAAVLALARFEGRRGLDRSLVVVLGVAASLVGFEAGRREVVAAVTAVDSAAWQAVLASVYAADFAGGVLAVGFVRRAADLRWLALVGLGLVIGKVGLSDLASVSTPLRILVTGCLGLVLLTAAYAYARGRRIEARPSVAGEPTSVPPSA